MTREKHLIASDTLFSIINELLAENRQVVFTITGMSMWPFLCHGRDLVVIETYDRKTLKKGDVILFQTMQGNYILHRITQLDADSFVSTGDGNCFHDGCFPRTCIKAKACRYIRKGKVIDCNSPFWKVIFLIWMHLFAFRRPLLSILRQIGRFL